MRKFLLDFVEYFYAEKKNNGKEREVSILEEKKRSSNWMRGGFIRHYDNPQTIRTSIRIWLTLVFIILWQTDFFLVGKWDEIVMFMVMHI